MREEGAPEKLDLHSPLTVEKFPIVHKLLQLPLTDGPARLTSHLRHLLASLAAYEVSARDVTLACKVQLRQRLPD